MKHNTINVESKFLGFMLVMADIYILTKTHSYILSFRHFMRHSYQYISMELCQYGDMESFMRNHPDKILDPDVCRILLFQMACALYVAGDRFGLRHYDVKLLNFFLASARPASNDKEHPHVVLHYGVDAKVFRLRMDPSRSFLVKLADFGTSKVDLTEDGKPITPAQFTTLENTPPDYLILGNTARQGIGHDSFGLGLCMLHLFTGHCPYEEILDEVVCPDNLKRRLRSIWKQKSHDVIKSAIFDEDENGIEVEDETLYNTLYRILVLFGIPEQFGTKRNNKVGRAINTTLVTPAQSSSKRYPDTTTFNNDRYKYSLLHGTNKQIANARHRLQVS